MFFSSLFDILFQTNYQRFQVRFSYIRLSRGFSTQKEKTNFIHLLFLMVPLAGDSPFRGNVLTIFLDRPARQKGCRLVLTNQNRRFDSRYSSNVKRGNSVCYLLFLMVPLAGVEPARYHYHWILSPARLPISPQRHFIIKFVAKLKYFW